MPTVGLYDLTNALPARASALKIPIDCLSVYCGISESQLRGLLNGTRVSSERMLQVRARLEELENLKRLTWPIPVNFRDVQGVRELLRRLRDGLCVIKVYNSELPDLAQLVPELDGIEVLETK